MDKKKYAIELEGPISIDGKEYWRAVGANTLFFDERGIDHILKPLPECKCHKEANDIGAAYSDGSAKVRCSNEKEEKKPYTGYVRVSAILDATVAFLDTDDYKEGDVIYIKDGKFENDGYKYPLSKLLMDFDDVASYFRIQYSSIKYLVEEIDADTAKEIIEEKEEEKLQGYLVVNFTGENNRVFNSKWIYEIKDGKILRGFEGKVNLPSKRTLKDTDDLKDYLNLLYRGTCYAYHYSTDMKDLIKYTYGLTGLIVVEHSKYPTFIPNGKFRIKDGRWSMKGLDFPIEHNNKIYTEEELMAYFGDAADVHFFEEREA